MAPTMDTMAATMDPVVDPDLFMRPDGLPMVFVMHGDSAEVEAARAAVEGGGGVLARHSASPHAVRLAAAGEVPLSRTEEVFAASYVSDCVRAGGLVPELASYRVWGGGLLTGLQHHDPLQVLLGRAAWAELPREAAAAGEPVPGGALSQDPPATRTPANPVRLGWTPYSRAESAEVVRWIVEHQEYGRLRGNSLWRSMEAGGVCGGRRTWSGPSHTISTIIRHRHLRHQPRI